MSWQPRRISWWIGVLFAIGSICFILGPAPGYAQLVGSAADGITFFVGSVFFTSAALLQLLDATRPSAMWWAALIQFAGTLFFNLSTFAAMQDSLDTSQVNRLVWRPDLFGSICFLVSGAIAYRAVRGRHTREWRIDAVNLLGCILFMIAAIAGYVVPETGDVLDLAAANLTTALGAVCFLIGALLTVPGPAEPALSPR